MQQATEGVSLAAQEAACRAHAARLGCSVLAICRDEGISGRDSVAERPGLQAAIATVQAHADAVLVAYSVSRVSRRQSVLWSILDDKDGMGIPLSSASEPFDTATPMGRAMLGILAVWSQLEADMVSERTRDALAHIRRQGVRLGAAPLGLTRLDELDEHGRRVFAESERERAAIARIVELNDQGLTLVQIAETLQVEGITSKKGGRWYASTVRAALLRAKTGTCAA